MPRPTPLKDRVRAPIVLAALQSARSRTGRRHRLPAWADRARTGVVAARYAYRTVPASLPIRRAWVPRPTPQGLLPRASAASQETDRGPTPDKAGAAAS